MLLTLNIYGENDEIIKTYETAHIRWRLFTEAVKLNDEIGEKTLGEQMDAIGDFLQSVFVGLTREELELADINDVFNNFKMIINLANKIDGGNGKNA